MGSGMKSVKKQMEFVGPVNVAFIFCIAKWPESRDDPHSSPYFSPVALLKLPIQLPPVVFLASLIFTFKAPTHHPDIQLPYSTTLRPLCCLSSDPFSRKVALKTPLWCAAYSTVAYMFCPSHTPHWFTSTLPIRESNGSDIRQPTSSDFACWIGADNRVLSSLVGQFTYCVKLGSAPWWDGWSYPI